MGVAHLHQIAERLMTHGRSPQTPVSLVRVGTTPQQQVVQGTLDDIVQKVEAAQLKCPAVIVIGEVNRLRQQLRCLTPSRFSESGFWLHAPAHRRANSQTLGRKRCPSCPMPYYKIHPVDVDTAYVRSTHEYDWIIFTSINAVEIFYERLRENGKDARAFGGCKICAVGPKTLMP